MASLVRIAKSSGMVAVFLLAQVALATGVHATPACSGAAVSGISVTPANCQWHYSTVDSGNVYGSATAPPPNGITACTLASQCSDGVRQDAGATNILYNNFYSGTNSGTTTSCRFVDNNNDSTASDTGDLFVPQNSLNEFTQFVLNAPNIGVAYCVQGGSVSYTAIASYGTGFEMWNAAGTVITPGTAQATSAQVFSLPTTRETNYSLPQPVNPSFSYIRKDCITDAAGTELCNSWPIVEKQQVTYVTVPSTNPACAIANVRTINPKIDCDGSWAVANVTYSCSVNGGAFPAFAATAASCLANFDPPTIMSCEANGTSYSDGTPYQVAATGTANSTSTPAAPACGSGYTGTQTCTTNFDYNYTCNDGTGTLTSTTTPVVNVASCTGCVAVPPAAPCTTGTFGSTCASAVGGAVASIYTIPPIPNSADYAAPVGSFAGENVTGSVAEITAANLVPGLTFYTSTIDIPLQPWTQGFPGYPNLTEWFGVCYDASWTAPTAGKYTFVTGVDDSVALYVDGKVVFDNNDGAVSTTITNNNCCSVTPYNPNPVAAPAVTLTAGTHQVMIEYMQLWPVTLGVQVWVYPPGSTIPSQSAFNAGTVPPNSDLMQLSAPSASPPISCPQ